MNRQPRYQRGQKIGGRFLVHQALMGGMGEVYLCLDEQEMAPYALKTFQGSSPSLRAVFEEEVSHWVALEKHPNIVQCFWMQTFDNIPFMRLEWVACDESHGTDLRSWLRHGPLDLALALRFTIDICRGLVHAGEKVPGIVHRDLKPDNVLVNQSRQAKITDFGLATVAQRAGLELDIASGDGDAMQHSRYVGKVVGTPPYMAPEQWRGETQLDARTDIYAVGCILYELLTARWLYPGPTVNQLRQQHLEAPVPALSGDFPVELASFLERCLAKAPGERFERVALLLSELSRVYEAYTSEALPEVAGGEFTAEDYSNRGMTYGNLGQHERALADYDRALALDPGNVKAYSNRGNSYAALGQHERAIADYGRALELDPGYHPACVSRGNSYAALGQLRQAIADYDRALALEPSYPPAYVNRGIRYAALGQLQRALADYDRAIALDPGLAPAWLNKGATLGNQADFAAALQCFEKAAELGDPQGAQYAARVRQILSMAPAQSAASDPQVAFGAFQRAESLAAMQQTAQQYPILTQMIPAIEQAIAQQVPRELRPALEQRLAWLRQIAKGR